MNEEPTRSEVPDDGIIGATLRTWRLAAGWTQTEAGAAAGMGQSPWSRVESGERSITLGEAVAFSRTLGVSLEALRFEPLQLLQVFSQGPAERAMSGEST